jgi:hypothetical protein
VKTVTQKFSVQFLSTVVLNNRGDSKCLYSKNVVTGQPQFMAFVWVDRDCRYKIFAVEKSTLNIDGGNKILILRVPQLELI